MRRVILGLLCCVPAACTPVGDSAPAQQATTPTERAAAVEFASEPTQVPREPELEALARPESEPCTGVPGSSELAAHPDLALDLKLTGPRKIEAGKPMEVVASVRNGSKSEHHFAVLSGDGSQQGRREPQVWYSGFVDNGDGCWRQLETLRPGQCGLYDEDWSDEIVDLAPGASATLEWILSPATTLDMQEAGRIRLFLHYAYRAGETDSSAEAPDPESGAMKGVDAFELVSNPIEFDRSQPLELHLSARPHRGRGNVSQISDVVALELENVGTKARRITAPTTNSLHFELGDEAGRISPSWNPGDETLPTHRLAAGDTVPLLGESSPNAALNVHWYPPAADVFRIRASYQPFGEVMAAPVKSNWVEIDLR